MLTTLVDILKNIFPASTHQSRMEQYLLDKNIKTVSDIEHWQRQYETHQHQGLL